MKRIQKILTKLEVFPRGYLGVVDCFHQQNDNFDVELSGSTMPSQEENEVRQQQIQQQQIRQQQIPLVFYAESVAIVPVE